MVRMITFANHLGVKELQARVAAHLRREHRERHHKLL